MLHHPSPDDLPALTERFGGPIGRRASAAGVFFDPVPWTLLAATLSWMILTLRQIPCLQTTAGAPVNAFLRLCYSDIPLLYQVRGMATGEGIFIDNPMEYPVLIVAFVAAMRFITDLVGGVVGPDATQQQQLDAANIFFLVNAIALFVCFLITVWAHLEMGRSSGSSHTRGVRRRAWDAILIAASPTVIAAGLINWDALALALTAVGMLLWARKRPLASGALVGLAFAAKFYPLSLVPALFLLCLRAARMRAFGAFMLGGVVSWAAVNVPYMAVSLTGWKYFWTFNADRGADLGSIWYVIELAGGRLPNVSVLAVICMAIGGAAIVWAVLRAPRRPRVAQVALLILVVFLVFNKVYSPQYVLWLLPFVVLARPKVVDVALFTVSELLYFLAIWGFLEGIMGPNTGPDRLYWMSVVLRIGVQLWLAGRVVVDMWRPWNDPVREPYVDDPIGGVLDHAPDAGWMLGAKREPKRKAMDDVPDVGIGLLGFEEGDAATDALEPDGQPA